MPKVKRKSTKRALRPAKPEDVRPPEPKLMPGFVSVETTPGNFVVIPEQRPRTEFPPPESLVPGVKLRVEKLDPQQPDQKQMRGHTHTLIIRVPDRREFRYAQTHEPDVGSIFDAVDAVRQKLEIEQAERDFKEMQRQELERVVNSRGP